MKKFRDSGGTMKYLPDEVVREILLRLPVKSLLRFKSVCKPWLSLISDPVFAKTHFELASNAVDRFLWLTDSQTLSIDVDASFHDDSAIAMHNFPITTPLDRIRILGSCRGFVLFHDLDKDELYVWNPSTGCCKKLPGHPIYTKLYLLKHGFGYDSSNDDYLVAIASADGSGTHIDFLSLKNNSWRKVGGTHPYYMIHMDYQDRGVFFNGAIHWPAYLVHGEGEVILAFDLIQKNVREFPLPDDYVMDLEIYCFRVLGGCFSMSIVRKFRTDIWIMKEYGVKSSWSKSIMVSFEETPINFFLPVCFAKGGEILGINSGGLMKRNHEGELLELLELHTYSFDDGTDYVIDDECDTAMYTECLLALPSNVEDGGVEDRHQ